MTPFVKDKVLPTSIMVSSLIGAGIFSLPYIVSQIGFLFSLLLLLIAFITMLSSSFFYAELLKNNVDSGNIISLAHRYFGRGGSIIAFCISVFQMIIGLMIYLVLGEKFLSVIIPGNPFNWTYLYILATPLIFISLRRLEELEFVIAFGKVSVIFLIFFFSLSLVNPATYFPVEIQLPFSRLFLFLGPMLFALNGRVAIAEILRVVNKRLYLTKAAIGKGLCIVALAYLIFSYAVVIGSPIVSSDTITGLTTSFPLVIFVIIAALGWCNMWSSYVLFGYEINDVLKLDFKFRPLLRFFLIATLPIFFFYLGFKDFLGLVGFAGGILGSCEGFFIGCMYLKHKKYQFSPALAFTLIVFSSVFLVEIANYLGYFPQVG